MPTTGRLLFAVGALAVQGVLLLNTEKARPTSLCLSFRRDIGAEEVPLHGADGDNAADSGTALSFLCSSRC